MIDCKVPQIFGSILWEGVFILSRVVFIAVSLFL